MKPCPSCDEQIEADEAECPHCQMDLTGPIHPSSETKTNIGVITIILAFTLGIFGVLDSIRYTQQRGVRINSRYYSCKTNLKIIGLALHEYHDVYGSFPPAYITDEEGNPMHSWRVLILPFLDEQQLYNSYDFTEPWDSPVNSYVLDNVPKYYRCNIDPDSSFQTTTSYAAVFSPDSVFSGTEPVNMSQIIDGTSNTLLVGEVTDADIPWTKPEDINITKYADLGNPSGFSSHHEGGAHFLSADGAVRFIGKTIDPKTLKLLYQLNDGETVSGF